MLLLLAGCLGHILEAPFVLTTGLDRPRDVAASGRQTLLVADARGLLEVGGEGPPVLIHAGRVDRVSAGPELIFVLSDQTIQVGRLGEGWAPAQRWTVPGATDVQAWCDGQVAVLDTAAVRFLHQDTGEVLASWPIQGGSRLTLAASRAAEGCPGAWVAKGDQIFHVTGSGIESVATGLVSVRDIAADANGTLWVVHGEPAVLARVQTRQATTIARYLGEATALTFGPGALLPVQNVYLVDAEGTVDYLRPQADRLESPGSN